MIAMITEELAVIMTVEATMNDMIEGMMFIMLVVQDIRGADEVEVIFLEEAITVQCTMIVTEKEEESVVNHLMAVSLL